MSDELTIEEEFPLLTSSYQLENADIPLESEEVVVRPWKMRAFVRALDGGELDIYKRGNFRKDGSALRLTLENQNLRLCALAMVDPGSGNKLFRNVEEGIRVLKRKPAAGSEILAKVINRLNGQTEEEKDEIEGNSETTDGGGSSSD